MGFTEAVIGGKIATGGQQSFFDAAHPAAPARAAPAPAANAPLSDDERFKKYSHHIAELLSYVAGWSYSDIETFEKKLADVELERNFPLAGAEFFDFTVRNEPMLLIASAQVIRTEDKKTAIVCFRGTELGNVINWLTDAGTKKEDYLDLRVHSGFMRNFEAVWTGYKGILEHLFDLNREVEAIYISGHSLGGSMAQLAGLSLRRENEKIWEKVRGVYTYGQPMVVDDRDREVCQFLIGERLFRHIYSNDIVPHLPPLSTGAFDHVGHEYKFHPNVGAWVYRADHGSLSLVKKAIGSSGPFAFLGAAFERIEWLPCCKGRATQVFVFLGSAPVAVLDALFKNIEWLPVKMPWSFSDHSPVGYIESWKYGKYGGISY